VNGIILSVIDNGVVSDEEDPELDSPPPSPSVDRSIKKTDSRNNLRNHIDKVRNNLWCACMVVSVVYVCLSTCVHTRDLLHIHTHSHM